MNPYTIAWLVAAIAGVLGTLAMVVLTRHFTIAWLRRVLRWLPAVLMLVPVQVPGFEGNYAPAFVVLIFEALFQVDGQPMAAARILIVASVVGLAAIILAGRLGRRGGSTSAAAAERESDSG